MGDGVQLAAIDPNLAITRLIVEVRLSRVEASIAEAEVKTLLAQMQERYVYSALLCTPHETIVVRRRIGAQRTESMAHARFDTKRLARNGGADVTRS